MASRRNVHLRSWLERRTIGACSPPSCTPRSPSNAPGSLPADPRGAVRCAARRLRPSGVAARPETRKGRAVRPGPSASGGRAAGGERRGVLPEVERRAGGRGTSASAAADVLAAAGDLVLAVGLDRVDARAAGDRVLAAVAGGDRVVARPAGDRVVPGAARQRVVAGVALDVVIAALAALDVVAGAAVQVVAARAAVDVVVAVLAAHVVVAGVAVEVVVLLRGLVVAVIGGVVAGGGRRGDRAGRGGRGLVARLGRLGGVAVLARAVAAAVVADGRRGGGRRRGGRAGGGGRAGALVVVGLDGDGADAEGQQRAQAREKHALHGVSLPLPSVCRSGEAGAPGVRSRRGGPDPSSASPKRAWRANRRTGVQRRRPA